AVVSSRVADQFWNQEGNPFIHGTTYAGHPTCCAAAMANMDILEREDLFTVALEVERHLDSAVRGLADHPLVNEVRSVGGVLAAVGISAWAGADRGITRAGVFQVVRGRVVVLRGMGKCLLTAPALIITWEQIGRRVSTRAGRRDAVAGGHWPADVGPVGAL